MSNRYFFKLRTKKVSDFFKLKLSFSLLFFLLLVSCMTPVVKKESSKEINPSKLEEYQEESEPESIITGDQKEENTALNFEDKELVRVGLIDARKTVHIALNGLFSVFNNQKLIFSNLDKNEKWIISAKNNGSIAATSNLTGKKIEIKGKLRYLPQRKGSLTEIYKIKIGKGWHWQENKNLQFRGIIEFINYKGKLIVVNELPLDQYLYGVVPAEIHHSAPIEALKAQAILARTNIYASLGKKSLGKPYLIFSDVFSQVYKGLKCESEVSNEAVDQTSGLILTYKGKPIDAVFHSTSGGFMEANSAVWNGGQKEYLIAHPDFPLGKEPYTDLRNEKIFRKWIDSRPNSYCNMDFRDFPEKFSYAKKYFRWQQSYKRAALEKIIRKKAGINIGKLQDIKVLKRGKSGKIIQLKIYGSKRNFVVNKELKIRKTLSNNYLYSANFYIKKIDLNGDGLIDKYLLKGAGFGHGVGMSQMGAVGMALDGKDYQEILEHYFPKTDLMSIKY